MGPSGISGGAGLPKGKIEAAATPRPQAPGGDAPRPSGAALDGARELAARLPARHPESSAKGDAPAAGSALEHAGSDAAIVSAAQTADATGPGHARYGRNGHGLEDEPTNGNVWTELPAYRPESPAVLDARSGLDDLPDGALGRNGHGTPIDPDGDPDGDPGLGGAGASAGARLLAVATALKDAAAAGPEPVPTPTAEATGTPEATSREIEVPDDPDAVSVTIATAAAAGIELTPEEVQDPKLRAQLQTLEHGLEGRSDDELELIMSMVRDMITPGMSAAEIVELLMHATSDSAGRNNHG
jgi:hypothetical protein